MLRQRKHNEFKYTLSASYIGAEQNRRDIRSRCDARTSANWVGVKPPKMAQLRSSYAQRSANWVGVKLTIISAGSGLDARSSAN